MIALATVNGKKVGAAGAADLEASRPLAEQTLLSFREELGGEQATLSFGEAARGVLVLGAVGTGKTSAVCLPALARAMQAGCPGLALDAKGEFSAWARGGQAPQPERVLMLGPWEDCVPCNLIAGWSAQKMRGFLGWLASKVSAQEGYWGSEGVVDGVLAWEAMRWARAEEPTLADVFWALSDPRGLCRELEAARAQGAFDACEEASGAWRRVQERARGAYVFSLFHAGGLEGASKAGAESSETRQQYAWQSARLLSALRKVAETPALKAAFCAQNALDWEELWIERGAMVFLDCPQSQFGEACAMASSILRANFRDVVKGLSPARRRELGFGRDRFWLWICDEFQQIAREGGEGLSDDDSLWLDSSRAWGVINVLATQSVSSLRSRLPQSGDALAQNCRALIALPSADEATVARCAFLAGPQAGRVADALARPLKDRAFLHFHGGARWAAGCLADLRSGESPFMRERFDLDAPRAPARAPHREASDFGWILRGATLRPARGTLAGLGEAAWRSLRHEASLAIGPVRVLAATAEEAGAVALEIERALLDVGAPWAVEALGGWRAGLESARKNGALVLCAQSESRPDSGAREWARSLGLSGAAIAFHEPGERARPWRPRGPLGAESPFHRSRPGAAARGELEPMLAESAADWGPRLAESIGLGSGNAHEIARRLACWAAALAGAKAGAVEIGEGERASMGEAARQWIEAGDAARGRAEASAGGASRESAQIRWRLGASPSAETPERAPWEIAGSAKEAPMPPEPPQGIERLVVGAGGWRLPESIAAQEARWAKEAEEGEEIAWEETGGDAEGAPWIGRAQALAGTDGSRTGASEPKASRAPAGKAGKNGSEAEAGEASDEAGGGRESR
jgi:hypothetical protein